MGEADFYFRGPTSVSRRFVWAKRSLGRNPEVIRKSISGHDVAAFSTKAEAWALLTRPGVVI
jgi:hypothetical protein